MIQKFAKVAVIGAGTMGNGIAHVFAQAGYQVNLIEKNEGNLAKGLSTIEKNLDRQIKKGILDEAGKTATMARIHGLTGLAEGVGDRNLVVEAATENIDLKLSIFRSLDELAPAGCILATNTSSISITRIAAATRRSSHVVGMHFFNPVPVMKLVEIISGYDTTPELAADIVALATDLGKVPTAVKDYPGFISNRILMPMINEAIYALYEGIAGVEEIDTVMKLGMAHPMGPLRLADFIGLDTCQAILEVLYEGFGNPKYAPCPLLKQMVAAGHYGEKTKKGFYTY